MTEATPQRRWFQFSLRSLLVFVTLCAIPCSWLAVRMRYAEKQEAERQERLAAEDKLSKPIRDLGGTVHFKPQCVPDGDLVILPEKTTDLALAKIKWWPEVKELALSQTQITDAGLTHLKGLTQLARLDLERTGVTAAGLENLKCLDRLQELRLGATRVTDAELEHLERFKQLQVLGLGCTQVSDVGLAHLEGLRDSKT